MEIVVTEKATRDLEQWLKHIAADSRPAAEAFEKRILRVLQILKKHPEAGHRHPKRHSIRKLVEAPIIIYYELFEDRVEILRFWHGLRNPRAIRYRT